MNLDLKRHAVMEASAGTGKTYTIERIVLHLLEEAGASLDQILVMTFTEKATADLRGRLRQAIEEHLGKNPHLVDRLAPALEQFDQAPIFTIHAFCKRLLDEYPLEQGLDFAHQLVDDGDLIESALREVQRRRWPELPDLPLQLDLIDYRWTKASDWEEKVREAARRYRPAWGDLLRPEAVPSATAATAAKRLQPTWKKLRKLAGEVPLDPGIHPWVQGYLGVHAGYTNIAQNFLGNVLTWIRDYEPDQVELRDYLNLVGAVHGVNPAFQNHGFLFPFFKKSADDLRQACPNLEQALDLLEKLRAPVRPLEHQMKVRTIHDLHEELDRRKRRLGLVSFDDMIAAVARGLDPEHNPQAERLAQAMRDRFRWALVDEFQDTDRLQWAIFRRLFLEGGRSRLIVVGDPKQAIFGFRGADLPTYLRAREDLLGSFGAQQHDLTVNWRTIPELLEPLNRLFGNGPGRGGMFPEGGSVEHEDVSSPSAKKLPSRVIRDDTGAAPLTLIDWREEEKGTRALRLHAAHVAAEIARLLNHPERFRFHDRRSKQERGLEAGDICLLVFRRREAAPLIEALEQRHIPFSFHRETGLAASSEAYQVRLLFEALARPEEEGAFRRLLMTRFFRVTAAELAACPDIPSDHPARALFRTWVALARERAWAPLLRSVLEDTGLLPALRGEDRGDRQAANFRFLLHGLEKAGYEGNLDLGEMVRLTRNGSEDAEDRDRDVQPVETEAPRVRIMTVHASKGLEFPIVFLCGGFTTKKFEDLIVYHDDQDRLVIDLTKDEEGKDRRKRERQEEERRLIYVALTRAIFKLYVPWLRPSFRGAGPTATLLAPALKQAFADTEDANVRLLPGDTDSYREVLRTASRTPSELGAREIAEAYPATPVNLAKRRIRLQSFSLLARRHRAAEAEERFGEPDPPRPADEPETQQPEDRLRGKEFGTLIHALLERIDFAAAAAVADPVALPAHPACRDLFAEEIERFLFSQDSRVPRDSLRKAVEREAGRLVWLGLRTPLVPLGGGTLAALPPQDRLAELEFLFPREGGPLSPEAEEHFYVGVMDLVFRSGGKYWLLDWKTNLLEDYSPAGLTQAMEASDYHRQYRLYLQALRRWLAPDQPPEDVFGGVFYLFLRGLNGRDDTSGVFFKPFEPGLLEG